MSFPPPNPRTARKLIMRSHNFGGTRLTTRVLCPGSDWATHPDPTRAGLGYVGVQFTGYPFTPDWDAVTGFGSRDMIRLVRKWS